MKDFRCQAFQCPLPGSMSHSIGKDATFFCRFHWKAEKSEHKDITEDLLANPPQKLRPWQDLMFVNGYGKNYPIVNPAQQQIDKTKEILKGRIV